MKKIYLEVGSELIEISSASQMQDSNNTFYRCDAEEHENLIKCWGYEESEEICSDCKNTIEHCSCWGGIQP